MISEDLVAKTKRAFPLDSRLHELAEADKPFAVVLEINTVEVWFQSRCLTRPQYEVLEAWKARDAERWQSSFKGL